MISPELLRRFTLFAGLPPEMLADMAHFCIEEVLEDNTYLFQQKDNADELFFVLEGTVDLLMDMDDQGKRRTEIESIVTGELVGWSALVEPHRYKLSGVAVGDVRLVVMNAVSLREYLDTQREWSYLLMQRLAQIIGTRLDHMRTRFISMV